MSRASIPSIPRRPSRSLVKERENVTPQRGKEHVNETGNIGSALWVWEEREEGKQVNCQEFHNRLGDQAAGWVTNTGEL